MILKARAANGVVSLAGRVASSFLSGRRPFTGGTSTGDGKYSTTASRSGCTPRFLNAEPQSTGTIDIASVPLRIAARSSSSPIVPPSRYFSINDSSASAAASMSFSRYSSACGRMSAGMSSSRYLAPRLSSSHTTAFIVMRSMTPRYLSSLPSGSCTGTAFARRRSFIMATVRKKSAPTRSILLTNARRGTLYLLAWRQTVSDCGCTPPTES